MSDFSPQFKVFAGARAAAAIGQQEALNDFIPDGNWALDLDERTLDKGGLRIRNVSLLGSYSQLDQNWLWGWGNPGFGWQAPSVASTRALYDLGEQLGIPELTTAELDFSGFPDPQLAAATLAIIAGAAVGGNGAVSTFPQDQAIVVRGFLHHHGIPYVEESDRIVGNLTDGKDITIEFNDSGRITSIEVEISAR